MSRSAVSCLPALTLSLLCSGVLAADPAPADWSALARRDLQFAADTIATRHAGVIDGQPSVTIALADGRQGLQEAAAVRSEGDYLRLMRRFFAGFGDPHTAVNLKLSARGWTGIVLDQVAGRLRVSWSEPGWPTALPPVGAVAQSCDGSWTGTYLKLKVAPYVDYGTEYASALGHLAQQSMFDIGLDWTPRECTFVLPDGVLRRYALPLRAVPAEVSRERLAEIRPRWRATATPVGVTALGRARYWVGMPDFNGASSGRAYDTLYPALAALSRPDWIVIDLRGNGGGDSSWGQRALQALYGEDYGKRLEQAGEGAKYLVADGTTITQLEHYAAAPEYAASRASSLADLAAVRAALREGRKLAQVSGDAQARADRPLAPLTVPRSRGPRLAAVIDRNCFSSCMNMLQQIVATGDALVLGESTIGYSPFGEIARLDLPSGRGAIYIPSALFRTAQATGEPFLPDHRFPGNMADDAALTAWVGRTLDAVEADGGRPE